MNNSKSSRKMPGTPNSSVKPDTPKPINVFYIWYTELCRRSNSNPIVITKGAKSKCNTVLDFEGDRLKFEDWSPLINALRHDTSLHVIKIRNRISNYQFLHDVDTEDKARRTKRKYGFIWTDYVLNSLMKALSNSLKNSEVVTCLELNGLPLFAVYLDQLLQALKMNKTLTNLSLANSEIGDEGCRSVCTCLQLIPNVESLNLSNCALTSESGQYVGKLIKYQQLNRYTASWHNSLRYSEPNSETMRGIRRITLNGNTKLGDVGLNEILNELEDDLWIKALDMQLCGITENIAPKLLDILRRNQSLQIADFRMNVDLNPITQEKLLELLKAKTLNVDSSLQWCSSFVCLSQPIESDTSRENSIALTSRKQIHPLHKVNGIVKGARTTTVDIMRRTLTGCVQNSKSNCLTNGKRFHLNFELKQEVGRRETKYRNDNTHKQPSNVEHINGIIGIYAANEVNGLGKRVMKTLKNIQSSNDRNVAKDPPNNTTNDSLVRKKFPTKSLNTKNKRLNGVTTGFKIVQTQKLSVTNTACDIFEKFFGSTGGNQVESDSDEENDLISYCENYDIDLSDIRRNSKQYLKRSDISDSQISLFEFMEQYNNNAEPSSDPKNLTSKHHYKGKKNGIK